MKIYKHKQTGNVAMPTTSGKNYKVSEPQSFTIPKWIIEESTDWEEVKEYEILEVINKNSGETCSEIEDIQAWEGGYGRATWEISKVKRVSDGEIFTIGDNYSIMDSNITDKILNFDLLKDNILRIQGTKNTYMALENMTKEKELGYEILMLQNISSNKINSKITDIEAWEKGIGRDNYRIYKIERISDGEIFAINDKVNDGLVIYKFEDTKVYVRTLNKINDMHPIFSIGLFIEYIKHYNTFSLFTTEDGVDIYKGDAWYEVYIEKRYHCFNKNLFETYKVKESLPNLTDPAIKRFSTKEAAEKWIDNNKPIYSKKEIRQAVVESMSTDYQSAVVNIPTFNNKLNL